MRIADHDSRFLISCLFNPKSEIQNLKFLQDEFVPHQVQFQDLGLDDLLFA